MEENTINELLEQLKSNLSNVEAAQKQVEKTVHAYSALQNDVEIYTRELGSITNNTKTLIVQLEEVKKKFLENVSTGIIEEIRQSVTAVKQTVSESTNAITNLCNELKTYIANHNQNLTSNTTSIKSSINSVKDEVVSKIASSENILTTSLNKIQTSLDSLSINENQRFDTLEARLNNIEKKNKNQFAFLLSSVIVSLIVITILFLTQ